VYRPVRQYSICLFEEWFQTIVVLGESNENNVIVEQGLNPGDQIYLNTPEDLKISKLLGEELIPVIREKEKAEKKQNVLQMKQH